MACIALPWTMGHTSSCSVTGRMEACISLCSVTDGAAGTSPHSGTVGRVGVWACHGWHSVTMGFGPYQLA